MLYIGFVFSYLTFIDFCHGNEEEAKIGPIYRNWTDTESGISAIELVKTVLHNKVCYGTMVAESLVVTTCSCARSMGVLTNGELTPLGQGPLLLRHKYAIEVKSGKANNGQGSLYSKYINLLAVITHHDCHQINENYFYNDIAVIKADKIEPYGFIYEKNSVVYNRDERDLNCKMYLSDASGFMKPYNVIIDLLSSKECLLDDTEKAYLLQSQTCIRNTNCTFEVGSPIFCGKPDYFGRFNLYGIMSSPFCCMYPKGEKLKDSEKAQLAKQSKQVVMTKITLLESMDLESIKSFVSNAHERYEYDVELSVGQFIKEWGPQSFEPVTPDGETYCYGTIITEHLIATTCSCGVEMGIYRNGTPTSFTSRNIKYKFVAMTKDRHAFIPVPYEIVAGASHPRCTKRSTYWSYDLAIMRSTSTFTRPLQFNTKAVSNNIKNCKIFERQGPERILKSTLAVSMPDAKKKCTIGFSKDILSSSECITYSNCSYSVGTPVFCNSKFEVDGIMSTIDCYENEDVIMTRLALITQMNTDAINLLKNKSSFHSFCPILIPVIYMFHHILHLITNKFYILCLILITFLKLSTSGAYFTDGKVFQRICNL